MNIIIAVALYIKGAIQIVIQLTKLRFMSSRKKDLEIVGLRSQLALYEHQVHTGKRPKPKATPLFRLTWVFISKHHPRWKNILKTFQPETVIRWWKFKFTDYWAKKSKRTGRPPVTSEVVNLIRQFHQDNPLLSPEKIHERLVILGVKDAPAPNTIKKYMTDDRKPPTEKQKHSWKMFLKNHSPDLWATDFFTIPTLKFNVLHVLIIIHHESRRIVYFNVTTNPNANWVIQQFRNATPFGDTPKYLIHDNDPIFRSRAFQRFLKSSGIQSKRTAYKSPWQNAYAERVIGTIKKECTNHIISINEKHLRNVLNDYIHNYYNSNRTHQGLNGQTPIPTPTHLPVKAEDVKLKATPVMNGLYHTYKRTA